ncbi:general stress protein [Nostoc sp.]
MSDQHKVVNMFPTHVEAEVAVLELQKVGFDMNKISIIGQDYQTTEHVRGFLTWKDTAKLGAGEAGYWGSFFGGLFGILSGVGLLFVPGVGPVIIAGHINFLARFQDFRQKIYNCFESCSDACMDLLDALAGNTGANSIAELSIRSFFSKKL